MLGTLSVLSVWFFGILYGFELANVKVGGTPEQLSHGVLDRLKFVNSHRITRSGNRDATDVLYCTACQLAVELFFDSMASNSTTEEIIDNIVDICVGVDYFGEEVCRGIMTEAVMDFVYMYEHAELEKGNVCGLIFQDFNCQLRNETLLEWTLEPPASPKPPVLPPIPIEDIDFVVWTGDLPPHDEWETAIDDHKNIVQTMTDLLVEFFPGIPVYGAIGNHESHPINAFPMPEIDGENNIAWLYNAVADAWSVWLPEESLETLRYGGYYSVLVKPGLRIISGNLNYCYTWNWWLIYESQDPANGLQFISVELEKAELAGEKVYLISHIIPGKGDCWKIYTRELNKVINRFESLVAGQFYGHSHNDEFKIFFDLKNPDRAINVAWVGPSLTSYSDINPGYKLYTLDGVRDGSTFGMLEHEAWIMNLTQANIDPMESPEWFKLYNGRDTFGLASLSPADMADLVDRLIMDDNLFQTYYLNYVKNGDPAIEDGCDAECKADLLCSMVTSDFGDQSKCQQVRQKLQQTGL